MLSTLALVVALSSQPPTPSLRPVSGNEQRQTTSGTHEASGPQQGTKQRPFVVKIQTTAQADKEAADEANYAKQETTNNGRLLIITCVLAAAALFQWVVMWRQARLLNQQIQLGNKEYVATHRPRLYVQKVSISSWGRDGSQVGALIEAINGGETPCYLSEWEGAIYFKGENATFDPKFGNVIVNGPWEKTADPGRPVRFEIFQDKDYASEGYYNSGPEGVFSLFLVGRITYVGKDDVPRVTGFCRALYRKGPYAGTWRKLSQSEYEYTY